MIKETFNCVAIDFADTPKLEKATSISYLTDKTIPHLKFHTIQDVWIEFENIDDVTAFKSIEFLANYLCLEKIDHITLKFLHEFTGLNESNTKTLIIPFFFSAMKDGLPIGSCKYVDFKFDVDLFRQVPYKIGIRTFTFRNFDINVKHEFNIFIYKTREYQQKSNIHLEEDVSTVMLAAFKDECNFVSINNITAYYTMAVKYNLTGDACKYVVPKLYGYNVPKNNLYMIPYDVTKVAFSSLILDIPSDNCTIYTCSKIQIKIIIEHGTMKIPF